MKQKKILRKTKKNTKQKQNQQKTKKQKKTMCCNYLTLP